MPLKKKKVISLQEILLIVAITVGALVVTVVAILKYSKGTREDELAKLFSSSTFESAVADIGRHTLPEDGGYYVYLPEEKKVVIIPRSDINGVYGYVYDDSKCRIVVYSHFGKGDVVGYSEELERDIRKINVFAETGMLALESKGLELDFARYYLSEKYPDACIIRDGKCFRFTPSGESEAVGYSAFRSVIVQGKLTAKSLEALKGFSGAERIYIPDSGDYLCRREGIYNDAGNVLMYLYPWTEEYSCPPEVVSLASGCFRNCDKLKKLTIPYTGKEIRSLFSGEAKVLERIVFTSALVSKAEKGLFSDCPSLRELEFPVGMRNFDSGVFEDCGVVTAIFKEPDVVVNGGYSSGSRLVLPLSGIANGDFSDIRTDGNNKIYTAR